MTTKLLSTARIAELRALCDTSLNGYDADLLEALDALEEAMTLLHRAVGDLPQSTEVICALREAEAKR